MKVLDIYITEICNLNCEYCYVDLKKKEYDGFEYKSFTTRVDLLKFDIIKFLGGEPLLKFNEIKKIIISVLKKNKDIKFSVITNGLLITEDKLKFFRKNNTSLTLSIHEKGIKSIINKNFLYILYNFKEIIGFSLLYNYSNIKFSTIIFSILVKLGFRNFSITPLADIGWNNNRLQKLKGELSTIKGIVKNNHNIKISGAEEKYLKHISSNNFCTKVQVDKKGENKLCNRFHKEYILKDKNKVEEIHYLFDKYNSCNSCKDKWFCTCPIGWYLDKIDIKNKKQVAEVFHSLNEVFIDFYKDIVKIKKINNFFTENISEIRFNVTEQCNLRCNYCYLKFTNNKLDIEKAKNIINFLLLQDGKSKNISFFGGEPLLEYNLMKELVIYTNNLAVSLDKKIKYKIATNLLLLDKEKIIFLEKNNFEIHISINGIEKINNITRDNSFKKLEKNLLLINNHNNIVALIVIFPIFLGELIEGIKKIKKMGFKRILFEIYIGNLYSWTELDYKLLYEKLLEVKNINNIIIDNNYNHTNNVLDISTSGKISSNSIGFFNNIVDFSPKKELNKILNKIFN